VAARGGERLALEARTLGPASEKPALITTAAAMPFAPQRSMMPGTVAAGVAITARSTGCGRRSTEATHGTPLTWAYLGFTANKGPANPAPSRLRSTRPATLSSRSVAPTSATERGAKSGSR